MRSHEVCRYCLQVKVCGGQANRKTRQKLMRRETGVRAYYSLITDRTPCVPLAPPGRAGCSARSSRPATCFWPTPSSAPASTRPETFSRRCPPILTTQLTLHYIQSNLEFLDTDPHPPPKACYLLALKESIILVYTDTVKYYNESNELKLFWECCTNVKTNVFWECQNEHSVKYLTYEY